MALPLLIRSRIIPLLPSVRHRNDIRRLVHPAHQLSLISTLCRVWINRVDAGIVSAFAVIAERAV